MILTKSELRNRTPVFLSPWLVHHFLSMANIWFSCFIVKYFLILQYPVLILPPWWGLPWSINHLIIRLCCSGNKFSLDYMLMLTILASILLQGKASAMEPFRKGHWLLRLFVENFKVLKEVPNKHALLLVVVVFC